MNPYAQSNSGGGLGGIWDWIKTNVSGAIGRDANGNWYGNIGGIGSGSTGGQYNTDGSWQAGLNQPTWQTYLPLILIAVVLLVYFKGR